MEELEFRRWPKIKRLTAVQMTVTQKLDGTNSQVVIQPDENNKLGVVAVGSRNRWITPEQDNFGFAQFVYDNEDAFIESLGYGRHYGEWCGPGIQTGEGLEKRQFFTFNYAAEIPPEYRHLILPVPLLYQGTVDIEIVRGLLTSLKLNGSTLNGFDRPEGLIVHIGGERFKVYVEDL